MKRKILSLGLAGIVGILGSINVFADNAETSKKEYKVKMEKSNVEDKVDGKTQEEWLEFKLNNCKPEPGTEEYKAKEDYKAKMGKSNLEDKTGGKTQEEWAEWKINNCK